MAMPICCEDQIIGYAIIGQFRDTTQLRSPYADIWEHRFGNTELQKAYESAPSFSEIQIEGMKKLFRHSIPTPTAGHYFFRRTSSFKR